MVVNAASTVTLAQTDVKRAKVYVILLDTPCTFAVDRLNVNVSITVPPVLTKTTQLY